MMKYSVFVRTEMKSILLIFGIKKLSFSNVSSCGFTPPNHSPNFLSPLRQCVFTDFRSVSQLFRHGGDSGTRYPLGKVVLFLLDCSVLFLPHLAAMMLRSFVHCLNVACNNAMRKFHTEKGKGGGQMGTSVTCTSSCDNICHMLKSSTGETSAWNVRLNEMASIQDIASRIGTNFLMVTVVMLSV